MIFFKSTPAGLTPKQKEVFQLMANQGYELFCNEGADYKVWLEKTLSNGKKSTISVNRRTAEALDQKEIIIPDNSFTAVGKFKMKLK